jgi:hypothetical protein
VGIPFAEVAVSYARAGSTCVEVLLITSWLSFVANISSDRVGGSRWTSSRGCVSKDDEACLVSRYVYASTGLNEVCTIIRVGSRACFVVLTGRGPS